MKCSLPHGPVDPGASAADHRKTRADKALQVVQLQPYRAQQLAHAILPFTPPRHLADDNDQRFPHDGPSPTVIREFNEE
jgi:hypothetical protein